MYGSYRYSFTPGGPKFCALLHFPGFTYREDSAGVCSSTILLFWSRAYIYIYISQFCLPLP